MEWTPQAEAQLKEVPFFVRLAVRKKIEKLAQEQDAEIVTEEIYQQAKAKFNSK